MCSSLILYVNILCGHTAWANVNGSRWVHYEKIIVAQKKSEENSLNLTEMSFFFVKYCFCLPDQRLVWLFIVLNGKAAANVFSPVAWIKSKTKTLLIQEITRLSNVLLFLLMLCFFFSQLLLISRVIFTRSVYAYESVRQFALSLLFLLFLSHFPHAKVV